MADSVGNGFPVTNLNVGWAHYYISRQTLYVWNGGDPADESTWSEIGGSGEGGGSGVVGVQRWYWSMIGTELSVDFGAFGEKDFIVPADGTITKWGVIIGNASLVENADMEIHRNPFGDDELIDSETILSGAQQFVFERTVLQVVLAGDVIAVYHQNTLDPTNHEEKLSGYVEFTPS